MYINISMWVTYKLLIFICVYLQFLFLKKNSVVIRIQLDMRYLMIYESHKDVINPKIMQVFVSQDTRFVDNCLAVVLRHMSRNNF